MKIWAGIFTICLLIIFAGSAYCDSDNDYAVLVQETPAGAGSINPGIGVHSFSADEMVTITTVPRKGYHFVCWLGDVTDPGANRTTFAVDGPKIIIAVFERDAYDFSGMSTQAGSGNSVLTPLSGNFTSPVYAGGTVNDYDYPDSPDYPDNPIEPVPEPTTAVLLATGCYLYLNKRRSSKPIRHDQDR